MKIPTDLDIPEQELQYKILKIFQDNPEISQRVLAKQLGISLGKANYCVRALISRSLVKVKRFKSSNNKFAYVYLLTPGGVEEKARVTLRFLRNKIQEYESMKKEIRALKLEVAALKK